MLVLLITLVILLITAVSLAVFFARRYLQALDLFEELEKLVQNSLEILSNIHVNITRKSKLDLFLDDPIIRDFINDLRVTSIVLMDIMSKLPANEEDGNNNKKG